MEGQSLVSRVQDVEEKEISQVVREQRSSHATAYVDSPPAYSQQLPAYLPDYSQQPSPAYSPQPPGYLYPQQQSHGNVTVAQQPTIIGRAPRPNNYIFLSIFALLCCFWPTAIVALVYGCQVNRRYDAGDYEGSRRASHNAQRWAKLSIIIATVMMLVVMATWIISSISAAVRMAPYSA